MSSLIDIAALYYYLGAGTVAWISIWALTKNLD